MSTDEIRPIIIVTPNAYNFINRSWRDDNYWTYFVGTHPVYTHPADNVRLFRLVTAQLINSGSCTQIEIINTFGVPRSSVSRSINKLRTEGIEGFMQRRQSGGRGRGTVFTTKVLSEAQQLLDEGYARREVSDELGVRQDTLRKAITSGRLVEPEKRPQITDKSSRTLLDGNAADGMGTACTRIDERFAASIGKLPCGAQQHFEACHDVPNAGVLCALPSLMCNGLLDGTEKLGKLKGYYRELHILLFLAFMALCRIRTIEQLRGKSPGEFGKLVGLDRIPEARCLRAKLDELSEGNAAEEWAAYLSQQWMTSEAVGTLYIDGNVRVYNGKLTNLPRKYVSRQRLCLRGTVDYWVNDAIGKPFFVIEKTVDPGLLQVLRKDVVPRLLRDVSNQPSEEELETNPSQCRFVLVFDREGYSPEFFSEMWHQHRIACICYHKFPGKAWPETWFVERQVQMPNGETVSMCLAEMGSLVGSGKNKIWMREVRKLTESGHQTSLISTAYDLDHRELSARMFTRWCQENFFRYMIQHFEIDSLIEHGTTDLSGTQNVVNPAWRGLDKQKRSVQTKLTRCKARFAELTLHRVTEKDPKKYQKWRRLKAQLLENIEQYDNELQQLKSQLKQIARHISWDELPEPDKFQGLATGRKRFLDTIRMIAYRAETAMVGLVTEATVNSTAGRRLMQDLFDSQADILPDTTTQKLRIRVHRSARPATDRLLTKLFDKLNQGELIYPGTQLQLVYELHGYQREIQRKCLN